jgi:hypothetical protein
VVEWSLVRESSPSRAWWRAIGTGLLFLTAAAASLGLRYAVVGLRSSKLRGVSDDLGALKERLLEELPAYALLGGLPLPFGAVDYQTLSRYRPLGWLLLVSALAAGSIALWRFAFRRRALSSWAGLYTVGMVIAVVSVAPVFWADLPLRRRYLYTPSIGIVLMAAALLQVLSRQRRRAAWALLAVLVAGGAAVTVHRNLLYLRSGAVARDLIETARQAPLGEPAGWVSGPLPRIALTTLPRAYGGDFLSGAYLFHESDLYSAFVLFGVPQPKIDSALKCYYAEDYHAEVLAESASQIRLTVRFRSAAAYAAARRRDPRRDRQGWLLSAVLRAEQPETQTLIYELMVHPTFHRLPRAEILVYSDGAVRGVALPAPSGPLPLVRRR